MCFVLVFKSGIKKAQSVKTYIWTHTSHSTLQGRFSHRKFSIYWATGHRGWYHTDHVIRERCGSPTDRQDRLGRGQDPGCLQLYQGRLRQHHGLTWWREKTGVRGHSTLWQEELFSTETWSAGRVTGELTLRNVKPPIEHRQQQHTRVPSLVLF